MTLLLYKKKDEQSHAINTTQISIGVVALIFGSLIYLIDRPPDQTYFVFTSPIKFNLLNLHQFLPNLFVSIGNILPDFLHVFSFTLITAGIVSCGKRGSLIICLVWFLTDIGFELGQEYPSISLKIIPDWFEGIPFLENSKNYFLYGTYDIYDIAAVVLGAATASFILLTTIKRREI